MLTAAIVARVFPRARADLAAVLVRRADEVWAATGTPRRLAHFLARVGVESAGLTAIEENLSYTAKRLTQVWPKRFPTIAAATPYARNPRALALKTYGGRLGNRPGTDDGWTHRGSGLLQNTGRNNFWAAGFLNNPHPPEALRTPDGALTAALAYWRAHGLNAAADADDAARVCKLIQGGDEGLEDQRAYLKVAKAALTTPAPKPGPTTPAPAPSAATPGPATIVTAPAGAITSRGPLGGSSAGAAPPTATTPAPVPPSPPAPAAADPGPARVVDLPPSPGPGSALKPPAPRSWWRRLLGL